MDAQPAIALLGDVVRSRRDAPASADWLRGLARELNEAYGKLRLAPFGFTQGDELQGLLRPAADPLEAVLRAGLRQPSLRMRWAIVFGDVEPGRGPATQRTGPVFLAARAALAEARTRRDELVMRVPDAWLDDLLADLAPVLGELLDDLSPRQRVVGRLLLIDGLRRADAAAQLHVSRATVSVVAGSGRIRSIERMRRALLALFREAIG